MNRSLNPEIRQVIEAVHYRPAISLILPLESNISLKTEMAHKLKTKVDEAERELRKDYPDEQCDRMMLKLRAIVANLDIPVKKKGIAIYVSPIFEKVLYLDSPVEEKMIIGESFAIRDLLYNEKQDVKFILLILSGLESKVFLGDRTELNPLPSNIPESVAPYVADSSERVSNFSDMTEHKQIIVEKFLHHIDEELGHLIDDRHLPIFVAGAEKILGHFKKLSKHTASVVDYITGNYENATIAELRELTSPLVETWGMRKKAELLDIIEEASAQHLVAEGIREVWQAACEKKGKLLIVEKDYRFAGQYSSDPNVIEALSESNSSLHHRDSVDEVMEKVLESGGDVEFIEDDVLNALGHIALIKYHE